jgi:hypothetical protein
MRQQMTDKLINLVIEVDKKDSSFIYFTFEANEGLCFYSTLNHEEGDQTRMMDINITSSLKNEFLTVFNFLKESIDIKIISDFNVRD